MKKIIILILLLLPSCTIHNISTGLCGIKYHSWYLEKKVKKAELIYTKECKNDDNLIDKWCECMQICMESKDIQALFKKYRGQNARWKSDKFVLTIKKDGLFNFRVIECEGKLSNI